VKPASVVKRNKRWNPVLPALGLPLTLEVESRGKLILPPVRLPDIATLPHGRGWYSREEQLSVIASIEVRRWGRLMHVSCSVDPKGELPDWRIVAAVKRALFPPDVAAFMPLPEEKNYINVAQALHLFQLPYEWGDQ